ncbi:hypothetical protein FOMPIDRAFT_1021248 [Fomitopsis schrenkii]|uniref:Uncharacterized protein n=1 Tax=Fomitopsis schrenkii TaxID=2126942 RepID=S8EML6_FOMSC|nr:hypothetical protein FOMPIDRAFT_1021248 [Fomitopsis schrenkii]
MRLIAESGQQRSIQGLLLRDGTMHFGIMLAVEIANTIPAITDVGYLDGLNDISQVILLSRFFLNLRNTIHATLDTESNPSDLRFSLKQSFGGSIDFGDGDDAVAEGRDGDDEDIEEFACDGHSPEDIGTENGSHHGEL